MRGSGPGLPAEVVGMWKQVEALTGKGYLLVSDETVELYATATVEMAGCIGRLLDTGITDILCWSHCVAHSARK